MMKIQHIITTRLKHLFFILMITLTGLGFQGCQPEFDDFEPDAITGDINSLYRDAGRTSETYKVELGKEQYLFTLNGSILCIPEGESFVDAEGRAIRGTVDITIKEYTKSGQLILNEISNIGTNSEILQSVRIFDFSFEQEGQTIFVNPVMEDKILVRVPTENRPFGNFDVFSEGRIGDSFAWEKTISINELPVSNFSSWEFTIDNETFIGSGHEFPIYDAGLVNLANSFVRGNEDRNGLCLSTGFSKYTDQNTLGFIAYEGVNTVLLLSYDEMNKIFCDANRLSIVGKSVTVGLIANRGDGVYEFDYQDITINESQRDIRLELVETPLPVILAYLDSL